ncbi:MAG: DUF373 family protein, partial [Thermoplasmata archaeon]|nr:DUF373 family protein [Thermoplasmata archaeon]
VNVGYQSDMELTRQLEEALEVTMATSVILVSNGAEDEYIFPMVSSRIKIDSVRSVIVKQSKGIESTWYFFVKILKDAKTRKKIIAPIGTILTAVGLLLLIPLFSAIYNVANGTGEIQIIIDAISSNIAGIVLFVFGIYLLQNAFRIREAYRSAVKRGKRSIYKGDVTIPMFIFAAIIFVLGIVRGYDSVTVLATAPNDHLAALIMYFLNGSFYWVMSAVLIFESRRMINALISRETIPRGFWSLAMFIVASTFLVLGLIHYMMFSWNLSDSNQLQYITEIGIGLSIAIGGAILQRRVRSETWISKEGWRR